jgi:hypothetical protein
MSFSDVVADLDDADHPPEERAGTASRSAWINVAVNLLLIRTQIVVRVLAKRTPERRGHGYESSMRDREPMGLDPLYGHFEASRLSGLRQTSS